MAEKQNTSYIFIPFCFEKESQFRGLAEQLEKSGRWELIHDNIQYLMKYITDKFDSHHKSECNCFHFQLKNPVHSLEGLTGEEQWYFTEEHLQRQEKVNYKFQIKSVQLYCFSTKVCVMAFRVEFEKSDPFWVASAQYYLKKVSRESIFYHSMEDGQVKAHETTFLAMAKEAMQAAGEEFELKFFYYTNPGTERANMLTYLEVDTKDDYTKELYFLKRCYHDGFMYCENKEQDAKETFRITSNVIWGFSSEAAVCLAMPEMRQNGFVHNKLYKNFNEQYLFMYVFLLHQKYVLYQFLTCLGIGSFNTLETLEEYQRQFKEFEADFVFSQITEVPQYQMLYEKMYKVHCLKKIYEDVREPLEALSELRKENLEKEKRGRENRMNKALLILSILTLFSVLTDSFQFIGDFIGLFAGATVVLTIQVVVIVVIVVIAGFIIKSLRE